MKRKAGIAFSQDAMRQSKSSHFRGLSVADRAAAKEAGTVPERRPRTKAEQRAESVEQIVDAAEYLFSKHGFYGVTLRDVAQRVGVHTTLVHYYFADKQALFE